VFKSQKKRQMLDYAYFQDLVGQVMNVLMYSL